MATRARPALDTVLFDQDGTVVEVPDRVDPFLVRSPTTSGQVPRIVRGGGLPVGAGTNHPDAGGSGPRLLHHPRPAGHGTAAGRN